MIGVYNYTVILTYLSVCSAAFGVLIAGSNPTAAVICLMISGVCDMFDGHVAKTKKDRSSMEKKFGIQIDSLSDMLAFGVLPSVIGYSIGMKEHWFYYIILILFPLMALIRLAYFNVSEEERQEVTEENRKFYEGLPVTNISWILPLSYCFHTIIGEGTYVVVMACLLTVVGVLYVIRFKMVKLPLKYVVFLIPLAIIGGVVMILTH